MSSNINFLSKFSPSWVSSPPSHPFPMLLLSDMPSSCNLPWTRANCTKYRVHLQKAAWGYCNGTLSLHCRSCKRVACRRARRHWHSRSLSDWWCPSNYLQGGIGVFLHGSDAGSLSWWVLFIWKPFWKYCRETFSFVLRTVRNTFWSRLNK